MLVFEFTQFTSLKAINLNGGQGRIVYTFALIRRVSNKIDSNAVRNRVTSIIIVREKKLIEFFLYFFVPVHHRLNRENCCAEKADTIEVESTASAAKN